MNTEQYFKDEFQAYPEIIRELITFFPSSAVVEALLNPERSGHDDALRGKIIKTLPGELYVIEEDRKLPGQKSPALAKWSYLGAKETVVTTWLSPLLKQERYAARRAEWRKVDEHWLTWLVAINIQQKVWGIHKSSFAYQQLNNDGKHLVELVGSAMKVVRKKVSAHLQQNGIDLSSACTQAQLSLLTKNMLEQRINKARDHLEALPDDFKKGLFSYFRSSTST